MIANTTKVKETLKLQHLGNYNFDLTKNGKELMSFKPSPMNTK